MRLFGYFLDTVSLPVLTTDSKRPGRASQAHADRDYKYLDKLPWQEALKFDFNHFKACLYTFFHLFKHYRMKKYEIRTDTYAIINDIGHGFSLLTYYISVAEQVRQLVEAGFVDVEPYGSSSE